MREGLIPTLLGSTVLAAGTMIRGIDMERHGMHKRDLLPMIGAGLVGFGLAHVILGAKDLVQK
ncbi:MAG: asparagine synthase [Clostridia bacterium]